MSKQPTTIRWTAPGIRDRVDAERRRTGQSSAATINALVDEALRAREHPGIVFRDGPSGRRAGLAAGPDVWEIVRALNAARAQRPKASEQTRIADVVEATGVSASQVEIALGYYLAWRAEIDSEVDQAARAEDDALAAFEARRDLLA